MAHRIPSHGLALLLAITAVAPARAFAAELTGYVHERRQVAEGVWTLLQPKFFPQPAGNVTVIEQADGFVLIDAGGSPGAARRVVEQVRALGPKPVKAILVTHWHPDHPHGLDQILTAFPDARTISTIATQRHLSTARTMSSPAAPDPEKNRAMLERMERFVAFAANSAAAPNRPLSRKAGSSWRNCSGSTAETWTAP